MLFFRKFTAVSAIAIAGFAFGSACSSDDDSGAEAGGGTGNSGSGATGNNGSGDSTGSGGDGTGNTGTGGTNNTTGGTTNNTAGDGPTGTAGTTGTTSVDCGGPCQCNDGIDNDDDGQADGFDIECQGPLDNDEGSFATGIPGDNIDEAWADCFFDGDSGAGNDGCMYRYGCLTGDVPADSSQCDVTQQCLDYCGVRTPNGCDCFGCCTVTLADGESIDIITDSSCVLEEIDNPDVCTRCVKDDDCQNTCGDCELCPGRTVDDLPESCTPEGGGGAGGGPSNPPVYTCEGADVCSDTVPCPGGYYCSLGCCIPYVK